jgi:hypothetical protein
MNIKKFLISGVVGTLVLGVGAVSAFAAPVVSMHASSNSCFGQARAYYAKGGPNGLLSPNNNGYYISQRKGTNPSNNANYIATYCSI